MSGGGVLCDMGIAAAMLMLKLVTFLHYYALSPNLVYYLKRLLFTRNKVTVCFILVGEGLC